MTTTLTAPESRQVIAQATGEWPLVLRTGSALRMSSSEFLEFCRDNPDWRIERNGRGEILIMAPTGWDTGDSNSELNMQLRQWAKEEGNGKVGDSSTGFSIPGVGERSPDASWVRRERLAALAAEQRRRLLPIAPDFAAEIRSPSDNLATLQAKMEEFLRGGVRLGLLIDPENRRVYVYRPEQEVQVLEDPARVSCDPELPGLELDMTEIFEPTV